MRWPWLDARSQFEIVGLNSVVGRAVRVAFTREERDVFVIGGGPSGLAVAIAARRKGFAVTVADGAEPPIDKACGEGMMPATQTALKDLGVELPCGIGYPFRGIRFLQRESEVSADFPQGLGMGIRRTLLQELLIKEAEKSGVQLLWRTPVLGLESGAACLTSGTVRARWIIGADGSYSRVRSWSGLDWAIRNSCRLACRRHYRVHPWSEFMEIYWGPRVQACVTPISKQEVCVVTIGETSKDVDFDHAMSVLPKLRERLANAELASHERGATTAVHSLVRVWRGNVALVGDASGGVDAITGEGLRLAFRQALALADAMRVGDLRVYQRAHRQLARRPIQMGALMLKLVHFQGLRVRTLQTFSKHPELFARILRIHVGQATAGAVVVAGAQLGWQFLAG